MAATVRDFRTLLGASFWLTAATAAVSIVYSFVGESYIALALGLELVLVAAAAWATGNLQSKRTAGHPADAPLQGEQNQAPIVAQAVRDAVATQRLVLACVAVLVGLASLFELLQLALDTNPADGDGALGAVCLAVAFIWLVFGRTFQAISEADLPEARQLAFAFREAQWAALAVAAGSLAAGVYPPLMVWVGRLLFAWVLVRVGAEILRDWLGPLLIPQDLPSDQLAPISLLCREILFARGNPLGSLLRSLETKYGASMRSAWAIGFVKRAVIPLVLLLLLLLWGSTAVVLVDLGQLGARESFGRASGLPLQPGLHFKLPWPFGQVRTFAVKTVHQLPIGFVEEEQTLNFKEPRALLWTRGHAKEEFALVLGGGTELAVVNALLYYKIAEDPAGFRDYVYRQSNQEETLTSFAYRALMEETRGRTLDEVLSADRSAFSSSLADSVRRQARRAGLGLEVVDLALINLHPPIEAAGSYLDVINARLDARRSVIEADGKRDVALLTAETSGSTDIADAKIAGSRQVATAASLAAEFAALNQAYRVNPETFRKRLWIEAQEQALTGQRLFLVDASLLGEGGELLLDTRRLPATPVPSLDVTPPAAPSGVQKRD